MRLRTPENQLAGQPREREWSFAFLAAVAGFSIAVAMLAWGVIPLLKIVADPTWGMDYQVYLRAAKEIWSQSLYEDRPTLPFRYPPIAAVLFVPLRLVSESLGHNLVNVLSVAATVVVVHSVLGWYRVGTVRFRHTAALAISAGLVLGTPWRTELALGQINSILLACIIVAVTRRTDRFGWGALLGVAIAVKLAAGIVVPGALLLRQWRLAVGAVGAFLVSVTLGFVLLPANAAKFWLETFPRMSGGAPRSEIFSQNLSGALPRFAFMTDTALSALAWAALVALAVIGLVIALRQRDLLKVTLVLGIAGLLGQPVTWTHHWVWLGPAAVVFGIGIARASRAWPWWLCFLAVLGTILFPVGYAMPDHSLAGTGLDLGRALIASTYVLLGLALLVLVPLCPTGPGEESTRSHVDSFSDARR
ncbi:glycosyltransferase 87 family protein [Curtobacterium oceanosedimentum]|uniref:glycosyltransferase 87 family protein n=1 Tax=Curtobacterium oceanosedimentum TaxID=465820 RepID=UPI0009E862B8|nr:glycosyltransferase 87 family protein [Curtobacterium oceanosedimentum]